MIRPDPNRTSTSPIVVTTATMESNPDGVLRHYRAFWDICRYFTRYVLLIHLRIIHLPVYWLKLIHWLERLHRPCSQLQWVHSYITLTPPPVTIKYVYLQEQAQLAVFFPYFLLVRERNPWLYSAWSFSFSTSSFTALSSLSWVSNISAIQINGHPCWGTQQPACTQDASPWVPPHYSTLLSLS